MGGLLAIEQQKPERRQAGARHLAVEVAEVALAAALDDHRRQPPGEGLARQTAVPHSGDQAVRGDRQAVLGHRLAEEGMQQLAGPGAQAVAPEQLGVDELAQLPGLGRRQVLDVLQPGVAATSVLRFASPNRGEGLAEHRPGRMPGPARHRGDEAGRQAGQPLPLATVDDHRRIGRLEEDGITPLAGEQARRPPLTHPARHPGIVGGVDALQGGPDAVAERTELRQGERLDRLAQSRQLEAQMRGRGGGVGPLVALAPVAVEVEEAGGA